MGIPNTWTHAMKAAWRAWIADGGGPESGPRLDEWITDRTYQSRLSTSAWNNRLLACKRIAKYHVVRRMASQEIEFRWWIARKNLSAIGPEERNIVSISRLSVEQVRTLLSTEDLMLRAMVAVAVGLGLTIDQALNLRTQDFVYAKGTPYLDIGGRLLQVPVWTWHVIRTYIREHPSSGLLFVKRRKMASADMVRAWLKSLSKETGVRITDWRQLRLSRDRVNKQWEQHPRESGGSDFVMIDKQLYNELLKGRAKLVSGRVPEGEN